jgi:predicted DNA-binding protein with PD1-like motif
VEYKKFNGTWILVLKKGDRIIEKLSEFIDTEQIKSGYMYGIGAVSSVEIAHYDLAEKKYSSKTFEEPLELLSLLGNVAFKDNEKIVHCHIILGRDDMSLFGGHLVEGTIGVTCEIVFNELDGQIPKKEDPEIGLNLITFN